MSERAQLNTKSTFYGWQGEGADMAAVTDDVSKLSPYHTLTFGRLSIEILNNYDMEQYIFRGVTSNTKVIRY